MMSNSDTLTENAKGPNPVVVGGAGLLALLSASCCVLPIGLSLLGLGGTWLAMLGPFVVYRVEILVIVGAVLAWGWWRLWSRWTCARRKGWALAVLGFATVAFALAASSPLWEDEVTRAMFALWRQAA